MPYKKRENDKQKSTVILSQESISYVYMKARSKEQSLCITSLTNEYTEMDIVHKGEGDQILHQSPSGQYRSLRGSLHVRPSDVPYISLARTFLLSKVYSSPFGAHRVRGNPRTQGLSLQSCLYLSWTCILERSRLCFPASGFRISILVRPSLSFGFYFVPLFKRFFASSQVECSALSIAPSLSTSHLPFPSHSTPPTTHYPAPLPPQS